MIEFAVTLIAVITAFLIKRDKLTLLLVISWFCSLIFAVSLTSSFLPAAASMIDTLIAVGSLVLWTEHGSQRARIVGFISLVKLFIHFGVSSAFGFGNWWLYAILINSLFVGQCLIAGGLFHGLVNFIDDLSPRNRNCHLSSDKRQS